VRNWGALRFPWTEEHPEQSKFYRIEIGNEIFCDDDLSSECRVRNIDWHVPDFRRQIGHPSTPSKKLCHDVAILDPVTEWAVNLECTIRKEVTSNIPVKPYFHAHSFFGANACPEYNVVRKFTQGI